jgi:uncharacterized membrane protein YdfJ with MMPL/SSD domain
MGQEVSEIDMSDAMDESLGRLLRWVRRHPITVTTAALVLVAALAVPIAVQTVSSQSTQPPADLGPDETPLFI